MRPGTATCVHASQQEYEGPFQRGYASYLCEFRGAQNGAVHRKRFDSEAARNNHVAKKVELFEFSWNIQVLLL